MGGGIDLSMLIPIVAIFVGGLIAVASIMAGHQRKMAEMMRKTSEQQQTPEMLNEIRQLRHELQTMRGELHQTTIAVDDMKKQQIVSKPETTTLEQRVSEEGR